MNCNVIWHVESPSKLLTYYLAVMKCTRDNDTFYKIYYKMIKHGDYNETFEGFFPDEYKFYDDNEAIVFAKKIVEELEEDKNAILAWLEKEVKEVEERARLKLWLKYQDIFISKYGKKPYYFTG